MKVTYTQLHKLIDAGIELNVNTPNGYKKILKKFNKLDFGKHIFFNDGTSLKCANTHHIMVNNELKSATELNVNDIVSNKTILDILNVDEQIWYDFEIDDEIGLYYQNGIIHHNSGKSMTISLIAEFMRRQGKKGLLLVPNINLLTQFKNDIKDYNLIDLYNDTHTIGGGNSDKHFNCTLTISTWQSMLNFKEKLNELDYVITDEAHRFASSETSAIVKETVNCRYKWGFTGTLPEDPVQKMQLLGLFGLPKTYITSAQLIEMGLATPIKINSIIFHYDNVEKGIFKELSNFTQQLKFVKDHEKRNEVIVNLTCKIKNVGNTLVLGQHVEHLKTMYLGIMEKLYPEVKNIENKQITGKESFDFQERYGVYYISGSDDAKTRELTRKILEEDLFAITLEDDTNIRLHGNKEIKLMDGSVKLVKDLTEDDEIDDNFLNNLKKKF